MNWFGATGLVTVAKSTLKGAQKAIDKALDIKEEDDSTDKIATPASSKDESDSFFSTWGVKTEGSPNKSSTSQEPPGLWGSFTGSFFESPRPLMSPGDEGSNSPISQQPKRSDATRLLAALGDTDIDSELALADDKAVWEGFSKTQLVVESHPTAKDEKGASTFPSDEVKWRLRDRQSERSQNRNSYGNNNRLSVLSSESDRRSSDSVEVLGSTSCTASPVSDLPTSVSASSLASSAGLRPVSASSPDSVEIIPESSESHSISVEVLGSQSSSTSLSSPLDPCGEKHTLNILMDFPSPDSVELVPEDEEDVSFADDSFASASASESTVTQATILEPHGQFGSTMENSIVISETLESSGPTDIITSSISGRTDSSLSSLILDSSTDTLHSDHGSLGRSGMQLILATDYPQLPKTLASSSQLTASDRMSPTMRSRNSSLESIPTKLPASPKKSSTKSKEASCKRTDGEERKNNEVLSDTYVEDVISGVNLTDSSGEGTLMESSSDETIPGKDSYFQQSTSGYVKNLLADAMVDDSQLRVNSPVSVETPSDQGLRVGSEQTSGHTSGDELETTTSSDIEIISSPNGDGSSTTSRQSPAKHMQRTSHGPVDLLKFSGKMKALARGLEVGVLLQWLFIFFGLLSYCDACSSRGQPGRHATPRPNLTVSTPRPNTTEYDQFYECPGGLKEYFCLNGASCFEVRISEENRIYNCFCADGFWGSRCEYKGLDGTYRTYLIETAGIAGGVAIAIVVSFIVCASLYVHMRRRRQRRLVGANSFPREPRPFDKRALTRDRPEAIQLTSLA